MQDLISSRCCRPSKKEQGEENVAQQTVQHSVRLRVDAERQLGMIDEMLARSPSKYISQQFQRRHKTPSKTAWAGAGEGEGVDIQGDVPLSGWRSEVRQHDLIHEDVLEREVLSIPHIEASFIGSAGLGRQAAGAGTVRRGVGVDSIAVVQQDMPLEGERTWQGAEQDRVQFCGDGLRGGYTERLARLEADIHEKEIEAANLKNQAYLPHVHFSPQNALSGCTLLYGKISLHFLFLLQFFCDVLPSYTLPSLQTLPRGVVFVTLFEAHVDVV